MSWRVAKSLLHLRDQINAKVPNRNKRNDGTIGDAAHSARVSDHNPDTDGVVKAMDITNDPGHGVIARHIAEAIIASKDERVKYIISNRQICAGDVGPSPWRWRAYNGSNPHTEHVHISVRKQENYFDNVRDWALPAEIEGLHPPIVPSRAPAVARIEWDGQGKGSWYSQYRGNYVWRDDMDKPNSNALGVNDIYQGVSFYNRGTLGKWFLVEAPNGRRSIEQQTDVGPNPRTGKLIDISAAAAERFGYAPTGPKEFPTGSIFKWKAIEPPADIANLDKKLQAVRFHDSRIAAIV
jgi:hypothetical protein